MYARGSLLKHFRPGLLLLAVAIFSASAWAQSDPKPIPQKGGDANLITLTNPNPTPPPQPVLPNNIETNPCPLGSSLCADINFQNATGKTLTSITMFFAPQNNYVFNCPGSQDMLSAVFFDNCSQSAVSSKGVVIGEDITFSADGKNGFNGVASAQCVTPDTAALVLNSGCSGQYVGGLFAIDI